VRFLDFFASWRGAGRSHRPEQSSPPADDLAAALDAAFEGGGALSQQAPLDPDREANRELFSQIAGQQLQPIKDFVVELRQGTATATWIDVCRPVVRTILEAAEPIDLAAEAQLLAELDEALSRAQGDASRVLDGEPRDRILACIGDVAQALPEAFADDERESRREGIIVHSLLRQIPGVGHVTFERLYGAGITSLEALRMAEPGDLTATTGIPIRLSRQICDRIRQHCSRMANVSPDYGRIVQLEELAALVAELQRVHDAYELARAEEIHDPAQADEKCEFRVRRQVCVHQIEVVLAEIGELRLLDEQRRLPFQRRIERLQDHLKQSAEADAKVTVDQLA